MLGTKFEAGRPIHEMWLRITIDRSLLIHEAVSASDHTPYAQCLQANALYAQLNGIKIGPGWWSAVRARVGGTAGCTHIMELLRPMATTAYQTLAGLRAYDGRTNPERKPAWLDSCVSHASSSPVTAQLFPNFYKPDPNT
mgnify:FL=1